MFLKSLLQNILRTPSIRSAINIKYYSSSIDFDKLVKNNKVVVFMKGSPQSPKCGFTNAVVQILRMHGVNYDSHDVLSNEEMREGIKKYSSWPTIPQVFINGEFVGGCDIILQMHQNGDLIEELKKVGITSALLEKAVKEKILKLKTKNEFEMLPFYKYICQFHFFKEQKNNWIYKYTLNTSLNKLHFVKLYSVQKSQSEEMKEALQQKFPLAKRIQVTDVSGGCGSMFEIFVESVEFKGLPIVKQHRLINEILKDNIKQMHGLRIHTKIPN